MAAPGGWQGCVALGRAAWWPGRRGG
jgi:hypothetical protein